MTDFEIIPPHLAVKAMRDSGYKNAAYAIAELMDNSIQANASVVELLIGEKEEFLAQRKRARVQQIGILDNGSGMDCHVLQMALQFGNGLYLDANDPKSIGRFGMGLPNSSISQARRVDVWSWQDGVDKAIHSYLDVDKIETSQLKQVPNPEPSKIPEIWLKVGEPTGKSGTLVVWSKIDRCMWKSGKTIIDNSEYIVGRTYRRFLSHNKVKIHFKIFDMDGLGLPSYNDLALPNDPLYLMVKTSCPAPFSDKPMFQEWGDPMDFIIKFRGGHHKVRVRFSVAKEEARRGFQPLDENEEPSRRAAGAEPHGQHARRNVGVSIMRADRELDLDHTWSDPSEARDRWWGAEVDFPPALDDLFGVTNNKQSARYFSDLAKVDLDSFLDEGQSLGTFQGELEADEDPRLPLLEIANHIKKNISSMRNWVRAQTASNPKRKRYEGFSTEEVATQATEKRKQEGHTGESDKQETRPPEQREAEIRNELITQGLTEENADELAATTVGRGFKYTFAKAGLDTPGFFNVTSRGGAIIITLNLEHPAYDKLVEVLEDDAEGLDADKLKERLSSARDGLQLLLMAWARYEDEQPAGAGRNNAKQARWDWGQVASQFLDGD